MLTYVITDQKKFSQVEDIEFTSCGLIWQAQFIGELTIHLSDGTTDHFESRLYWIKEFMEKYGFIISES